MTSKSDILSLTRVFLVFHTLHTFDEIKIEISFKLIFSRHKCLNIFI